MDTKLVSMYLKINDNQMRADVLFTRTNFDTTVDFKEELDKLQSSGQLTVIDQETGKQVRNLKRQNRTLNHYLVMAA